LADALQENTTLRSLNLACCGITELGATVLGQALQENKTLTALNLSHNNLRTHHGSALVDAALARATATRPFILTPPERVPGGRRTVATELRPCLFSWDGAATAQSDDDATSC
jgi:hypothetical protein